MLIFFVKIIMLFALLKNCRIMLFKPIFMLKVIIILLCRIMLTYAANGSVQNNRGIFL